MFPGTCRIRPEVRTAEYFSKLFLFCFSVSDALFSCSTDSHSKTKNNRNNSDPKGEKAAAKAKQEAAAKKKKKAAKGGMDDLDALLDAGLSKGKKKK